MTTTEALRLTEIRAGSVRNFAVLAGRRVALLRNGQTRWIHGDPLGSARFFSDEQGNRIAQIAHHPLGGERSGTGVPVIRTFARHDYDDETGLIYMGHRWYAPQLGRFLAPTRCTCTCPSAATATS